MFSRFERLVAYRYLRSPRQEGFISVIAGFSFIGIALGVATLIIVMSVMNGFREELLKRIIGLNGHLGVYGVYGSTATFDELADKIRQVPGVQTVIPTVERQAMVLFHSQARGTIVHGIRKTDLEKRSIIANNIKAGSLSNFGSGDHHDAIAIGKRLSEKLGIRPSDRITLVSPEGNATAFGTMPKQRTFKVAAVFEVGMNEYDQSVIFMPLEAAQSFFKMNGSISNLEVFIDNPDKVAEKRFLIETTLGKGTQVFDWQHANNSLFQAVQVERNVMFIILTLIILIAAFNIISSLIMLVKDKTRDIAIMRTMGATQRTVMKIFFLTGATIGVVGTSLGVILGLSVALNIETIRQWLQSLTGTELFSAEIYFLTQLPAKVDWNEVILVVMTSLFLSFLATLYPSWKAARLDPVEALRQ
jgi:lipoprotein-releasing system permease protein